MSADLELICNYRNCRKTLSSSAWVTCCSHAFCEVHGIELVESSEHKCPACQSICDSGSYDIVRVDLKPSEDFKSMVLAGMSPEIILNICTRAITFWNHQMYQELVYQRNLVKKGNQQASEVEAQYKNQIAILENEIERLQNLCEATKQEVKNLTQRIESLNEKILQDKREYQNLQNYCSSLHRRSISSNVVNSEPQPKVHCKYGQENLSRKFSLGPQTMSDVHSSANTPSQSSPFFAFHPEHPTTHENFQFKFGDRGKLSSSHRHT